MPKIHSLLLHARVMSEMIQYHPRSASRLTVLWQVSENDAFARNWNNNGIFFFTQGRNGKKNRRFQKATVDHRSGSIAPTAFLKQIWSTYFSSKIWLRIFACDPCCAQAGNGWGRVRVRELEKNWYCTVDKVAPCPVPFLFRTGLLHDLF